MIKSAFVSAALVLSASSAFAKPVVTGLKGDKCRVVASSFINSLAISRYSEPKVITVEVVEQETRYYTIKFDYKVKNWEGIDVIEKFELALDNDSASSCLFQELKQLADGLN